MQTRLFVAGLPYRMTERELAAAFSACGKVIFSKVITDRATGKSKGFGFVEMATPEQAKAAIAKMHKSMIEGRYLVVSEARPESEHPAGGGKPAGFVERRSGFDRRKAAWPADRPVGEQRPFMGKPGFTGKPNFGKPSFGKKRKWEDKPKFGDKRPFGGKPSFAKKRGYKGPKRNRF